VTTIQVPEDFGPESTLAWMGRWSDVADSESLILVAPEGSSARTILERPALLSVIAAVHAERRHAGRVTTFTGASEALASGSSALRRGISDLGAAQVLR
jgi:hypothetical protein